MISETKLDNSFPTRQFLTDGYTSPYSLDKNGKCGAIFVFVWEDISSKIISVYFPNNEGFFIEINLRKKKWVICFSYNQHIDYISSHVDSMGKAIDLFSHNYGNFLMIRDFNA